MRPTFRIVASLVVASAVVVVGMPSAAQTARTLTVTPDTGLVDRDVVVLHGTGFTPSATVFFCQGVDDGTPGPSDCGVPFQSTSVDAAGEFSANYTVRRFMTTPSVGATIDCAQPSANCVFGATDDPLGSANVAFAPITFAPRPARTLTVTPDTGLVDGDVVAVHGTEFIPGDTVSICQGIGTTCRGESSPSAEVNAAGEFSANLTVQRFLTISGFTRVDCAVPSAGCAMLFSWPSSTGGPDRATVPLTFAPQPSVPQISGTLTDPGGAPVPGVDVWAYTPSDAWVGSLQTVTDAQGEFEFAQVDPGVQYRILFRPPAGSPLAPAWWSRQPSRPLANGIALSAAEVTEVDEQLEEAGSISGLVTDPTGNPVSGVQVSVFTRGDTWIGSHTTATTANGTYVIGDLLPVETGSGNQYRVLFAPPAGSGLALEWFDDAASRSLATDITVSAGQTVAGIDAQLEETGAISGSVTDTNGNPVSGVRVSAYGPGDRWVGSYAASTASDGTYVISNVRPTVYRILFAPPAGSGLASEWFDDSASRSLATDITVPPGQTATGIDAQLSSVP